MNDYYQIDIDGHFTSYKFYNQFLPELHSYFTNNRNDEKIIINFGDLHKISPLVIPNLLNVGLVLKEHFGEPVELFIPWNKKILTYLRDVNFLYLNEKLKIFDIDERYIGDIPTDRAISDTCGTILIGKDLNKEEIYNCYMSKYKTPLEKQLKNDKIVTRILFIMAELSHNGAQHSHGSCFVSFQLNQLNKFEFSVSDCGIGYRNSLLMKKEQLNFADQIIDTNSQTNYFISILESIYFRKKINEQIYGIYSIFNDVLPLDGIIRIHTYNTQSIFTKSNFYEFLGRNPNYHLLQDIFSKFIEQSESVNESKYSPVRLFTAKFKGVHAEIEIPFGN